MLKLSPFRTLRGRLVLLACFATLPAFLFVVYIAENERETALHRTETEYRYVAGLASREHAQQVQGARLLLDRLAAQSFGNEQMLINDFPKILPMILSSFPQFANLGTLTLDGDIAFSVVPPPRPVNMAEIPEFQRALKSQEVAVGTYLLGLVVERPILIMARALRHPDGSPFQVLFAALELAWLDQLARQASLPPESALLIVDREGTILASSLTPSNAPLVNNRLQGFDQLILNPNLLTRAMTPDGISRLVVATPLKGVDDVWVVVGPPESEVYALANEIFYRDLIVLALLTLFAIGSSLVATDFSVLRDLRLLAAATQRFGKGDLSTRAPIPRPFSEIRDLTLAFNAMASTLEKRHQQAVQAKERQRALSHRLQNAREEEASRIAQELHDELGQVLSVLRLELEPLRRRVLEDKCLADKCVADKCLAVKDLTDKDRARAEELTRMIDDLGAQIDSAVQSVRRIASELRPGVLDRLGLASGIEWLLNEFERRTGIGTFFRTEDIEEQVDSDISTALFRITQEAITNVARHANATQVEAYLRRNDQMLTLCLQDNGRGFDPADERGPSLGLLGMQERAWRLGGKLDIISQPGAGVTLQVAIPQRLSPCTETSKGNLS